MIVPDEDQAHNSQYQDIHTSSINEVSQQDGRYLQLNILIKSILFHNYQVLLNSCCLLSTEEFEEKVASEVAIAEGRGCM